VFLIQAGLEWQEVVAPDGKLELPAPADLDDLAANELLRGVEVGIDQPGHRDLPLGVDGRLGIEEGASFSGGANPDDSTIGDGNRAVANHPSPRVEGDDIWSQDQEIGSPLLLHAKPPWRRLTRPGTSRHVIRGARL